jgi:hypothetical protein
MNLNHSLIFHLWDLSSLELRNFIIIQALMCRRAITEQFKITERDIWRVQHFTNLYMMIMLTHTLQPCLLLGPSVFQEPRLFTSGVYSSCYLPFPPFLQFYLSLIILYILYVTHYPYNLSSVVSLNYPLACSVGFLNACVFRPEVISLMPNPQPGGRGETVFVSLLPFELKRWLHQEPRPPQHNSPEDRSPRPTHHFQLLALRAKLKVVMQYS